MTSALTGEALPTGNASTPASANENVCGPVQPSCLFWVALFLMKLSWDGPEEGDWWFDSGELVTDPALYAQLGSNLAAFPTEAEAYAHCGRMNEHIGRLNEGRRPKSSVCNEGEYEVLVLELPMLPRHWPGTPPRYE